MEGVDIRLRIISTTVLVMSSVEGKDEAVPLLTNRDWTDFFSVILDMVGEVRLRQQIRGHEMVTEYPRCRQQIQSLQ